MSDIEVKYYSIDSPISQLELDMIRYDFPDFDVEFREMSYRSERRVFLVKVVRSLRKIIVGYKE